MDSDVAPRSRTLPFLLLGSAIVLAIAIFLVTITKLPGRSFTLLQEGRVRAFGHRSVVTKGTTCTSCHR